MRVHLRVMHRALISSVYRVMHRPSEDQRALERPIDSRNKGSPQRKPFICNRDEIDGPRNLVTTVVPHFFDSVSVRRLSPLSPLFLSMPIRRKLKNTIPFKRPFSIHYCIVSRFFASYASKLASNLCDYCYEELRTQWRERERERERRRKKDTRNQCISTLESGLFGEWFGSFCYFNENAGISESARWNSAVCRSEKHREQKINFRALSLNKHGRRSRIRFEELPRAGGWISAAEIIFNSRFNRYRGIIEPVDKREIERKKKKKN